MRVVSILALLTSAVLWPSLARAEPIFRDVADELGMGSATNTLRVLPDSTDPNIGYLIPAAFAEVTWLADAAVKAGSARIVRTRLPGGLTRYALSLQPAIDLVEFLQVTQALLDYSTAHPLFRLVPLGCLAGEVELNGVPRHLLRQVAVSTVESAVDAAVSVPAGYLYNVSIDTDQPVALELALGELGVKGSVVMHCVGYPDGASTATPPVAIDHAIPVNAAFYGVIDG